MLAKRTPIERVCVVGAGAIGSLLAAHLSQVCEVWVLTRRPEQAERLRREGLRVSGKSELVGRLKASADAAELPDFDLGIVAVKATDLENAALRLTGVATGATMMTIQNGLGAEDVIARHGDWPLISSVTFMSGTRRSDVHVEYELDTPTWLGPWAGTQTDPAVVEEVAAVINSSGLRAEAMADLVPAQWSKLIFNSAVNSVSALTELPHVALFVDEDEPSALGHVVRALVREGKSVAAAAGIELHEDPWEMNTLAVARGETAASDYAHLPSMLEDVFAHRATEVDWIAGAIHREAARHGLEVPVTAAAYRLIKGKEASWRQARPAEVGT
ncbi:MAG: ketopantoate reductase family protein [Acetobacteraceae bacterium]|nr:ketopantoate reductase family protein [Acetobacteraceae bacterium]